MAKRSSNLCFCRDFMMHFVLSIINVYWSRKWMWNVHLAVSTSQSSHILNNTPLHES